jgi:hypothetical protein
MTALPPEGPFYFRLTDGFNCDAIGLSDDLQATEKLAFSVR